MRTRFLTVQWNLSIANRYGRFSTGDRSEIEDHPDIWSHAAAGHLRVLESFEVELESQGDESATLE